MFIKKHLLYGDERIVSFQFENNPNTPVKGINFGAFFVGSFTDYPRFFTTLHNYGID
jgi:hypothetical protein